MKITERLKTEICYFYFDISFVPFQEAGIDFKGKFAYLRILNQLAYVNEFTGYYICGLYDFFSEEPIKDILMIKQHDFVINQRLMLQIKVTGKDKFHFIGSEPWQNVDLPHMISGTTGKKDKDLTMYYTEGFYAPTVGKKTPETYVENVKHLGENEIAVPGDICIDLFCELIKRTNKKFSEKELHDLFIFTLKHFAFVDGELTPKMQEVHFRSFKRIMDKPSFQSIPKKYREKAINEVIEGTSNKLFNI